jgi:hypothetical protein
VTDLSPEQQRWLLLPADLREAHRADDDHFYGSWKSGSAAGGGGRAMPKSSSAKKAAGTSYRIPRNAPGGKAFAASQRTAGKGRGGVAPAKTYPKQRAGEGIKKHDEARRKAGLSTTSDKKIAKLREPTEREWRHEKDRLHGFFDKYSSEEKLYSAITRRANTIASPQKLYNFYRALEDENYHTINGQVEAIFEKKFGSFRDAEMAKSR